MIDSVASRGEQLTVTTVGDPTLDTFHHRIALQRPVQSGRIDTLHVFYSGTMTTEGGPSAWGGVWYEGQVLYALGVGFANPNVSATQHWMPCYDHPSDKATFRGTFRVPRDQMVASIGTLESVEIPRGDSIRAIVWEETHPTATYLYTFAVGQFQKLELTDEGVPHVVYSLDRDTADSRITYSLVPEMTRMYEGHFIPYPFDKVGYVNTRRGAMEHQTMISMPTSVVGRRDSTSSTVAHELAHMWFGDLVSPLDFRHAWLTEAFATYGEALWVEHLKGWDAYLEAMESSVNRYREQIAVSEGVMPLYDFPRAQPSSNYPETIYRKGQIVVGMMRALAGDERFFSALSSYLEDYAYGTATTDDLRESLRPALGVHTDAFFDQWIREKGWPRLTVTISPSHSSWIVTLRQTQHMSSLDWPLFTAVPLNIEYQDPITGEVRDSLFVMTSDTMSFEVATPADLRINAGNTCRSLVEITSVTTVLEPELDKYGFVLKPNPAFDSATVSRHRVDDDALVEVYDAAGREMFSAILLEGEPDLLIEIADWPPGSYMIRMITHTWASALPLLIVR